MECWTVQGRPDLLHDDFTRRLDENLIKELRQELLIAEYDQTATYGPAKRAIGALPLKDQASTNGQQYMWLFTSTSLTRSYIASLLTVVCFPACSSHLERMIGEDACALHPLIR